MITDITSPARRPPTTPAAQSRVQRGRRRLADLLGQCCALTLDARGLPMDYTPSSTCDRAVAPADPRRAWRDGGGGLLLANHSIPTAA